jgi:RimJ/RimL family protein N-acetyltransferase
MTKDYTHLGSISLRPFHGENDWHPISKWVSDPDYAHFFQSMGVIPTMEECKRYPQWTGNSVMMVAFNAGAIGMVSMYHPSYRNGTCEFGVLIDKEYQGNDLGRKATELWMRYLFSLGFRKLIVNFIDEGLCKLSAENGFVAEGVHERECLVDGKYVTEYRYAFFRRD